MNGVKITTVINISDTSENIPKMPRCHVPIIAKIIKKYLANNRSIKPLDTPLVIDIPLTDFKYKTFINSPNPPGVIIPA